MRVLGGLTTGLRLAAASRSIVSEGTSPHLRGVVFDMDGTLTVPNLDFGEMYSRCGVDPKADILIEVAKMPPAEAAAARRIIDDMEAEAAQTLELMSGAASFAKWIQRRSLPVALVTRNSDATLSHFVSRIWGPAGLPSFSPALSRDGELGGGLPALPAKPHPAALIAIAERWGLESSMDCILMVGDSPSNDVAFGKAAGTRTALLDTGRRFYELGNSMDETSPDYCVENLNDLIPLLENDFDTTSPAVPLS